MALFLARDLSHVAIVEYIESQPPFAALAADLEETIDGNVLIDAVKLWKRPSPEAIKPYFKAESPLGALAKLAQKLHLFVELEGELEKHQAKQPRYDLSDEQRTKLLKRIAEEQAAAVGP